MTLTWMVLDPYPSWYILWSLRRVIHFSMYVSLSMTTSATLLSAVRTIQLLSFFRLYRASLSSLVMLWVVPLPLMGDGSCSEPTVGVDRKLWKGSLVGKSDIYPAFSGQTMFIKMKGGRDKIIIGVKRKDSIMNKSKSQTIVNNKSQN